MTIAPERPQTGSLVQQFEYGLDAPISLRDDRGRSWTRARISVGDARVQSYQVKRASQQSTCPFTRTPGRG